MPRVACNYADWSLDEETYAKHLKSRHDGGISNVDVWNYLEYIAVVAANGITYLGVEAAGFVDFQKRGSEIGHPEFTDKAMDDVLSSTVLNFNAHASGDDSFYKLIGKDALDKSLPSFLILFPYLYDDRGEEIWETPPAVDTATAGNPETIDIFVKRFGSFLGLILQIELTYF